MKYFYQLSINKESFENGSADQYTRECLSKIIKAATERKQN